MITKLMRRLRTIKLRIAKLSEEAKEITARIHAEVDAEVLGQITVDKGPLRGPAPKRRKRKWFKTPPEIVDQIHQLRRKGTIIRLIAKKLHMNKSTVERILRMK